MRLRVQDAAEGASDWLVGDAEEMTRGVLELLASPEFLKVGSSGVRRSIDYPALMYMEAVRWKTPDP